MTQTRAATLVAAYYAVMFGALGAHLPYWPLWLDHWGLTPAEIGEFAGAAILARIIGATVLPALADRFAIRRWVISGTAILTAIIHLAHLGIEDRETLFLATLVAAMVMAPSIPLGEALGLRAASQHRFAYAPVRAAGSIAFLAANIAVGAGIATLGPDLVLWVIVIGFLGVAALGVVHPGGGAAASNLDDQASTSEILGLAKIPVIWIFALAVSTGQAGHGVYYVYSVLDWRAQNIDASVIGWLWAVGVIAETALMLGPGRRWLLRLGAARALLLAGCAGIIRWSVFALSPDLIWLWPMQALHALTFALAHLAAIAFIAEAIPKRLSASAQGFVSGLISGLVMAAATMGAARLVDVFSIADGYWLAVSLSAASCLFAIWLARSWQGGEIGLSQAR